MQLILKLVELEFRAKPITFNAKKVFCGTEPDLNKLKDASRSLTGADPKT